MKAVMICGTASDVGKTRIVTGICRMLARREIKVAPFKAQNMSLNSYVTKDNKEVARSIASQAQAAKCTLEAEMNPILLKPMANAKSQLVLLGKPHSERSSYEFVEKSAHNNFLSQKVKDSYFALAKKFDVIVLEGAGGAAEINLLENDIVNLPLAYQLSIPAILIADIERGGAFSSIYGTYQILPDHLRKQLVGFIVNKMRGDAALIKGAISWLEQNTDLKCLGVIPYLENISVDGEDSLSYEQRSKVDISATNGSYSNLLPKVSQDGTEPSKNIGRNHFLVKSDNPGNHQVFDTLDIVVIKLPHLANYTDFDPLFLESSLSVRFVTSPFAIGIPDVVILPGSKDSVRDLLWLKSIGLAAAIGELAKYKTTILGICAGYQMLGHEIADEVESKLGTVEGLGLLPVKTSFSPEKITKLSVGKSLFPVSVNVMGYEIHHGRIFPIDTGVIEPLFVMENIERNDEQCRYYFEEKDCDPTYLAEAVNATEAGKVFFYEGALRRDRSVLGTSWHGIFEADGFRDAFFGHIAKKVNKQIMLSGFSYAGAREEEIDKLADVCEQYIDTDLFWKILNKNQERM